ncbi:TMV resistance protein N-like [Pistacia vera]|uniref:TMV resistance protein N-like n=1 Tax=Pistacia vera TaxID=55513 RepID=UPI001262AE1E|nr:TMV resistance protein N-like [Pistacia vera]
MSMAGSLSSTNNPQEEHDVFLSFRGEDTRNGFTSHLYLALCRKKISTFIDDQIVRGDKISSFLLNTIKASKISVIIFSKNYATSRWCLQELEQILHCKKIDEQIVIPVFYHVDPSDVRNQTGSFGDGFAELEKHTKQKLEMLQRWKTALNEVGSLAGWTINDQNDYTDLIGIEFAIKRIESLLHNGSSGVSKIGIWGIGGVGKTTIARVVFNKIFSHFEGSYFVENVREESEESNGLTHLKKELLSTILEDRDPNIGLTFTRKRLKDKKVLIVFDDVTSLQQIENLIGNLNWLSSKSQIIITTKDKQVLRNCGVDDAYIYEVQGLREEEAHQLFNRYAFKQDSPIEDYMELSNKAISYTKCLPLALKVLGSYLFSKGKEFWESAIKELEKGLPLDIHKVLRVSYDGLEKEKDLFLDIACFFKGDHIDSVIEILNACDISAKNGIQVLIDKCLVFVTYYNKITMHDLLQEMGREIARDDSCKHIRLCHHMDIFKAFKKRKGTEAVRSINLDISKISNAGLNCHVLSKMDNLRFFRVYNSKYEDGYEDWQDQDNSEAKLDGFEELESFPDDITFFGWNNYPFKSLPLSFPSESLVKLVMQNNKVKHWNGFQNLVNLKYVDLSFSEHMTEIPNLSRASNLQYLILIFCSSLESLSSNICKLKYLKQLNLFGCIKLERLPDDFGDLEALEDLNTGETIIKEVPSSILHLPKLRRLQLCRDEPAPLNWVLNSLSGSNSLVSLNLSNCQMTKLPDNLGQLFFLENLFLRENNFESIPENIKRLSKLRLLDISNCRRLQLLPEFPMGVDVIAFDCSSLQSISDPSFLLLPHLRRRETTFANCFKLDLCKTLHKESCREFCASICFPGDEILKWFTFQNTGPYITLD